MYLKDVNDCSRVRGFTKLSGNKTIDIKEFQNIFGIQQRPAEVFATALVSLGLLNVNLTKNKDTKQEKGNVENKDYRDKDKENRYSFRARRRAIA